MSTIISPAEHMHELMKKVAKSCIPIYEVVDESPSLLGSGTLFVNGGRYFIITAAHLFEINPIGNCLIQVNDRFVNISGLQSGTDYKGGNNDKIEFTIIELDNETCRDVSSLGTFIPPEKLAPVSICKERNQLYFFGYPSSKNRTRHDIKKTRNKITCIHGTNSSKLPSCYYRDAHLAIDFSKDPHYNLDEDGNNATPPDPYGMSGGPVFLTYTKSPQSYEDFLFAGIGLEHHIENNLLIGLSMPAILDILKQNNAINILGFEPVI